MNRRLSTLAIGVLAWTAATAAPLDQHDAASGRRIFRSGGAAGEVMATYDGSNAPLPPRLRRCAGCHAPDGRGAREGGVDIPPITWAALTAPRGAAPGRPGRTGYDEDTLRRVLAEAIDPAGRRLDAGMPRFRLSPAQFTALFDYLRIVGTERDLDPGITADEILVGAVLPLSGAQAARGEAMQIGLENALAAAGPIYGRRLRIIATDAGNDAAAAMRRLVTSDRVFALVASLLPERFEEADDVVEIPIIGPLAPSAAQPAVNQFHLLAPVEDQMRVLVDELAAETPHPLRLAVIGTNGHLADAVADQAARNGAMIVRCASADKLNRLDPAPDAVLALPDVGPDLVADMRGDWLLAVGADSIALDGATDPRLRLVLPILPAGPHGGNRSVAAATTPLAVATAAILIEAIKRMGGRASRAALITALETLQEFPTGVLPPLTFGRGQHVGTRAAVVIRPASSHGFIVLGGWRTPR